RHPEDPQRPCQRDALPRLPRRAPRRLQAPPRRAPHRRHQGASLPRRAHPPGRPRRAGGHVTSNRWSPEGETLPTMHPADLADPAEGGRWLVASLWGRAAVGILGGAPKCCKSWLALDLTISVASHTPCLDRFAVEDPGPVLLYMAEDSAAVVKAR